MKMIAPNFDLFLKIMLLVLIINSICRIILGAIGVEKPQKYGKLDILDGIFWLIVVFVVLLL
jgi:hypothetical protein